MSNINNYIDYLINESRLDIINNIKSNEYKIFDAVINNNQLELFFKYNNIDINNFIINYKNQNNTKNNKYILFYVITKPLNYVNIIDQLYLQDNVVFYKFLKIYQLIIIITVHLLLIIWKIVNLIL